MKHFSLSFGTFLFGIVLSLNLLAQNEVDALRYSQIIPGGSSRFTSTGGAFGGIGGNISVAGTNPAGLSIFKSSSMDFTPAFGFNTVNNTFGDTKFSDFKGGLQINNLGFVFAAKTGNESGWKSTALAFNYTRNNSYGQNFYVEGVNNSNSITNYFAALGKGKHIGELDDYAEGLAYSAYLIDPDTNSTTSYHSIYDHYGESQQFSVARRGNLGEYQLSYAANYNDHLYLGGTFGVQSVNYKETTSITEKDISDTIWNFNSMQYDTYLHTTGSGINLKLGLIYRPLDWLKIGFAIHTPTLLELTDNYSSSLESHFDTARYSQSLKSSDYVSSYKIITPAHYLGSLGFLIRHSMLLSVEAEMVDYSSIRMSGDDYSYTTENNSIRQNYTATYNLRGGMEYRLNNFTIRLGGGYYGSPYTSNQINKNSYTMVYSGGFGFRVENVFFDFGYYRIENTSIYYLYDANLVSNAPSTQITSVTGQFSGSIRVLF